MLFTDGKIVHWFVNSSQAAEAGFTDDTTVNLGVIVDSFMKYMQEENEFPSDYGYKSMDFAMDYEGYLEKWLGNKYDKYKSMHFSKLALQNTVQVILEAMSGSDKFVARTIFFTKSQVEKDAAGN